MTSVVERSRMSSIEDDSARKRARGEKGCVGRGNSNNRRRYCCKPRHRWRTDAASSLVEGQNRRPGREGRGSTVNFAACGILRGLALDWDALCVRIWMKSARRYCCWRVVWRTVKSEYRFRASHVVPARRQVMW
jgi:hypothetical protein